MTGTVAATGSTSDAQQPGLPSRLVGVVFSPRDTYAAVAARPRVLGALLVSVALTAGSQAWFLSTDRGKDAMLDQQVSTLESFGVTVTDEMYDQMEQRLVYAPYTQAGSIAVFVPLMLTLIAGLLMMVFNVFLGGEARFRHVYAVLAHASFIGGVTSLFNMPIGYARGEMASAARLSVFFPMLDEMSFATYLLSAVDLFLVWFTISIAIGLAVLYKRRTGPIATSLLSLYAVIAVVIAAVRAS